MTLMPNFFSYLIYNTEYWDKRPKCTLEKYHTVRMNEGEARILLLWKGHNESNIFLYKMMKFNSRNLVKLVQVFHIHRQVTGGESFLDLKPSVDKRINYWIWKSFTWYANSIIIGKCWLKNQLQQQLKWNLIK